MLRTSSFSRLSLILLLFLLEFHGQGETLTLNPVADTTLIESAPNNNLGGQGFVNVGTTGSLKRNRALFRFDLSAIPLGSHITSAQFVLLVVGEPSEPPVSSTFNLYRVLKPWGEGNKGTANSPGQGSLATSGEATWNYRLALTTNAWASPGGVIGDDFATQISSSQYVYGIINPPYVFDTSPTMVADVQRWVDAPGTNFGWVLISESENVAYTARRFGSRESGLDAPQLIIDYVPPRMDDPQIISNKMVFSVTVAPGQTYSVQSASELPSTNWSVVTNIASPAVVTNVIVSDPLNASGKFYRLQAP